MNVIRKLKPLNQLILIILCLISFELYSQIITSGKLTYEIEVVLAHNWIDRLGGVGTESDTANDQELKEEITEFLKKHGADITDNTSNQIERWTYQFDSNRARIIGNKIFNGEAFDLYLFDKMMRIILRHHKGDIEDLRIDTMDYQQIKADRKYQVQINKDSIRQIKGYECYEVLVEEVRELGGAEQRTNYELYVTEKIKFSPSIILEWGEQIIDDCPIYIKSWINNDTKSYNEYRLVDFEEGVDQNVFEVPEKFKN